MDKDKIIKKVIEKLSNLNQKHFRKLPKLVTLIKENSSNRLPILLKDYKDELRLSDRDYALILKSLIKRYQVHLISKEHYNELKKITENRPVVTYFDLRY